MLRNVMVVLRGTAIAQIIGMAALPVMTRGFAPEAFGHYQAFQSILTFALVAASLRYEIAILRAKDERQIAALLGLCAVLNTLVAAILFAGLLLYQTFAHLAGATPLGFPIWSLPAALLLGGVSQTLGYFLTREHQYSRNANAKVGQALVNAGSAAGLAVTAPISSGIVLADIAGRVAGLGLMAAATRRTIRGWPHPSIGELRQVARDFFDLPTASLPAALINTLGSVITPLMIYRTFDATISGQFGLTERSISLPIALIVIAVSQVYMSNLAQEIRQPEGDPRRYFRHLTAILAGASIVPAILVAILAPVLFKIVFGPGWDQAAQFARLMMGAYWLALVSGAVNMTLTVVGRTRQQLAWDGSRLVAMVALWSVAPSFHWPIQAIIATHAAITAAFALILIVLSYRALPIADTQEGPSAALD